MPKRRFLPVVLVLMAASGVARPAAAAERFKSAVVALGLWSDPVFLSEASGAAHVLAARYGHGGPVIVRANSAGKLVAGPDGIERALAEASRGTDPERDVLFLLLTSHGSPDGIAEKGGGQESLLTPDQLAAMLAKSPFRRKVLIVSACFAGIYTVLADADTLVITAADATHPSFGCQPEAKWTYFGDAFFNRALRRNTPLIEAFQTARAMIATRETVQGFAPSNPQIAGGANVLAVLDGGP